MSNRSFTSLFSLFAREAGSQWTDADQPVQNARRFANLPEGDSVLIVRILATIPEPGTLATAVPALLALLRRRRGPKSN